MKVQFMSDLHLEFRGHKFENIFNFSGDILCLVGDICLVSNPDDSATFDKFLQYVCKKYKYVIHVPGNHEYYNTDVDSKLTIHKIDKIFKSYQKKYDNYNYLNNSILKIEDKEKKYFFIGTTLWSNPTIKDGKDLMSDYKYIYFNNGELFTPADCRTLFRRAKTFITSSIKKIKTVYKSGDKCILLTHHKPVADSEENEYTQFYETDITTLITHPITYAIHGHTHEHYDKVIKGVRYLSNPKGYIKQHTNFNRNLIIKL